MASFLYRFACRAFQKAFFVGVHFMPWREPQLIHGAGSLKELPKHLKANDIEKVLLVTDDQRSGSHLSQEQMQGARCLWWRFCNRLRKRRRHPHSKALDANYFYARDAPRSSQDPVSRGHPDDGGDRERSDCGRRDF